MLITESDRVIAKTKHYKPKPKHRKYFDIDGVQYTYDDIADISGLSKAAVISRISKGETPQSIIKTKLKPKKIRVSNKTKNAVELTIPEFCRSANIGYSRFMAIRKKVGFDFCPSYSIRHRESYEKPNFKNYYKLSDLERWASQHIEGYESCQHANK